MLPTHPEYPHSQFLSWYVNIHDVPRLMILSGHHIIHEIAKDMVIGRIKAGRHSGWLGSPIMLQNHFPDQVCLEYFPITSLSRIQIPGRNSVGMSR